jgi:putative hydrolase of the HAD superfamily
MEPELGEMIKLMYQTKGKEASQYQIEGWALTMRAIATEYVAVYEGAGDMIRRLKEQGKKVYLLSNAQRLFTEPEMRMLGIYDLFDKVYYSSDIGFKKPSWYFYDALIGGHGLNPGETVMVGNDWLADAWGASWYGIDSIYIHTRQSVKITGSLPDNCRRIRKISEVK